MLALTKNTVGNVYALLSHYCGRDLQDRPVIPFGGHVHVAKCDESQFKHKSKVRKIKDLYNRPQILGSTHLTSSNSCNCVKRLSKGTSNEISD